MSTDERFLLGAMMRSRDAVGIATELVSPEDLHDQRLEVLWRAIVDLDRQGITDQPDTVARSIPGGELERLGGTDAVVGVWLEAPPGPSAGYYAKRVAAQAARRRVKIAAGQISQMVDDAEDDTDPHAIVESAYSLMDHARPSTDPATGPVGDVLDEVLDSLDEPPRFLTSPWREYDNLVDGFRPGSLYVFGARPGAGKSIVGLQVAAHLARSGHVAFSSLEMSRAELMERLLAQRAGVHMSSISRHALTPTDWGRIVDVAEGTRALKVHIDDRSGVTMAQVRAHVRAVARRGKLSGVVVDYLQLLRSADPRRPRWEQVSEFSHGLKVMAREFDVPVLALAQLNRESETNRRLPTLSDLRESGSIEQDADVVTLMQRGYDDETGQVTDDLEMIVAKNRRGLTGRTTLLWEGQYARLSGAEWA